MRTAVYLLLAFDIILLDQLSKWWVMEGVMKPLVDLPPRGLFEWLADGGERIHSFAIEITPFFNLVNVWNFGISFGMFNEETRSGPGILIGLSLIITAWFTWWLTQSRSAMQSAGLAFVIGGAIGNVIDRFRFGAVYDFLDLHVAGYHWPAFNIADSAIVTGVAILLVHALFFDKEFHTAG